MYRSVATSLFAALLFMPADAAAQGRFGLGLGLQNTSIFLDEELGFATSLSPLVYVPIELTSGLIIEPGVAFLRFKESDEGDFGDTEFTASALRLGVGVLIVMSEPERGRIYAGPRVGIMRISSTAEFDGEDSEMSRMDLAISAVLGGEFFLFPAFSLGGEAGLNYVSMGEVERDPEPDFEDESEASALNLGTEFRVRWYFR